MPCVRRPAGERLGVMPATGPPAFDTSEPDDHSEPIPGESDPTRG